MQGAGRPGLAMEVHIVAVIWPGFGVEELIHGRNGHGNGNMAGSKIARCKNYNYKLQNISKSMMHPPTSAKARVQAQRPSNFKSQPSGRLTWSTLRIGAQLNLTRDHEEKENHT